MQLSQFRRNKQQRKHHIRTRSSWLFHSVKSYQASHQAYHYLGAKHGCESNKWQLLNNIVSVVEFITEFTFGLRLATIWTASRSNFAGPPSEEPITR